MPRLLLVVLAALLLPASPGRAAEWGTIEPGMTILEQVRARYGAPSKETRAKVEGYDSVQWVYEGARAPGGLVRMVVDFGLLTPLGYKAGIVRVLRLEPKPRIFRKDTVVKGWGVPDGLSTQDGRDVFFYKVGLLVTFEKGGDNAAVMTFTMPPPAAPPASAPARR